MVWEEAVTWEAVVADHTIEVDHFAVYFLLKFIQLLGAVLVFMTMR